MKFELGDHSYIRCEKTELVADIEFKTKGFISGTYNALIGKIKRDNGSGEVLYEISGKWTEEMWIKNTKTGEKELLFNAAGARHTPCQVRPLDEQEDRESRRLWQRVTQAIIKRDQATATEAKTAIEDRQREETRARDADDVTWHPRFFKQVDESFYIFNHKMLNPSKVLLTIVIPTFLPRKSRLRLRQSREFLRKGNLLLIPPNRRLFPLIIRTRHHRQTLLQKLLSPLWGNQPRRTKLP